MSRRLRSCRWMGPRISRSNSSRCPRPMPCRAGAWVLPPAMRHLIGALARIKSYLDYGAFTPIQVAAAAALNGPQDVRRRNPRHLQIAPRRAGQKHGAGGLGHSRAGSLDVRLGAGAGEIPRGRLDGIRQADADRTPRWRCRPGSASANMAKAMSAWRWWRTSTASARRRAM